MSTKTLLRQILREAAQPVAVVTSLMAPSKSSHKFHGATLSSFTSIAMDPRPLVSFALRVPSRMATSLKHLYHSAQPIDRDNNHMVINILSAAQHHAALAFSRPDLYPHPFASPQPSDPKLHDTKTTLATSSSLLHANPKSSRPPAPSHIPYHLSPSSGLPILDGSLGAFSCRLLTPGIPLHDPTYLEHLIPPQIPDDGHTHTHTLNHDNSHPPMEHRGGGVISELFIAQVTRIELPLGAAEGGEEEDFEEKNMPLVYHRRGFTTCR